MQGETGSGQGGILDKVKDKVSSFMGNSQSQSSLKQHDAALGQRTGMASQTESASSISADVKARARATVKARTEAEARVAQARGSARDHQTIMAATQGKQGM